MDQTIVKISDYLHQSISMRGSAVKEPFKNEQNRPYYDAMNMTKTTFGGGLIIGQEVSNFMALEAA